jgi:hypothetical protein
MLFVIKTMKAYNSTIMKKYKNVWLSLGAYVLVFAWYLFFISPSSSFSQFVLYKSGDVMSTLVIVIYFLFIFVGLFFGFKSRKEEPNLINNLITIIGILLLIGSLVLFSFHLGWGV